MNKYVIKIGNRKKDISIDDSKITIDGKEFEYDYEQMFGTSYILKVGDKFYDVSAKRINREKYVVVINGNDFEVEARTTLEEKAREVIEQHSLKNRGQEIKAPMPGMILKVNKKVGDSVSLGESIMILEAMKMENELKSPKDGKIKEVLVKEGDAVEKGAKLFSIE